jgi:hypothetical protein
VTDAAAEPPPLDDFTGDWVERAELEHLHSLRNQWGQAHVNGDLTSISWLAMPPYVGGYHTGVLRVDGRVLGAERFSWAPWGVQREAVLDGLCVRTDTRMAFEAAGILWRIELRNDGTEPRTVTLDQELLAPVAHSEVDWGWLYGTPWNAGHYHDYYATERIRREALEDAPRQAQLLPHDARVIRLGSPRLPGIQRDEDAEPMLMESALPDHSTSDSGRTRAPAVLGTVSGIEVTTADGDRQRVAGTHELRDAAAELRLDPVFLGAGATLAFDFEAAPASGPAPTVEAQTGVILTHGNHPDSVQFGLHEGRVWLALGGERVVASELLTSGSHRIEAAVSAVDAVLVIDGHEVARTAEWWRGQRWSASIEGGAVLVVDAASPARSAYGFASAPDRLEVEGQRASARWSVELIPGETASVSFRLDLGDDADAVLASARAGAAHAPAELAAVADRWRELWRNAFTPGNPDHSGYLPVLDSPSAGLARTYYFGILLALYLRNTGVSSIGPVFLTGGPRLGATTTFYWDLSEWPRTAALLEPVGLRAWILAALAQPYDASHSFDTRNLLPVGNHYASNDHALFRIVESYVAVTGDLALLDETAGALTVIDHLRRLVYRPRTQHVDFGDRVLVDLGRDAWELLECVPNYRDAVVSFNAGYVGMLRSFAELLRLRGLDDEADVAAADGDRLARAVLGQYAGHGRWRIAHPDGEDVIGHCLDFELVAAAMAEDLTPAQREEMVAFVTGSLIDGDWMHALDPDDPIAPFSDRPDHGAAGAFAGWPGSTSYGLSRLGRADLAAEFLARVHNSRSGALWGQAVEHVGGGRYRVAERGVSNRDSNAAVAVTEAVLAGLFGIRADFGTLQAVRGSTESPYGTLHGVRAVGFDLAVETVPEPLEA